MTAPDLGLSPVLIAFVLSLALGLVVLYEALMARAILQMLRLKASGVLLTFAFIALIPFPLILILGVMIMVIWRQHKKDLAPG